MSAPAYPPITKWGLTVLVLTQLFTDEFRIEASGKVLTGSSLSFEMSSAMTEGRKTLVTATAYFFLFCIDIAVIMALKRSWLDLLNLALQVVSVYAAALGVVSASRIGEWNSLAKSMTSANLRDFVSGNFAFLAVVSVGALNWMYLVNGDAKLASLKIEGSSEDLDDQAARSAVQEPAESTSQDESRSTTAALSGPQPTDSEIAAGDGCMGTIVLVLTIVLLVIVTSAIVVVYSIIHVLVIVPMAYPPYAIASNVVRNVAATGLREVAGTSTTARRLSISDAFKASEVALRSAFVALAAGLAAFVLGVIQLR